MIRQKIPKILIISSDTGGGHRSAAAAIVAGVNKFWESDSFAVRTVRAIEESHGLTQKMVGLYNWLLRNRQHWMKYLYWGINRKTLPLGTLRSILRDAGIEVEEFQKLL